MCDIIQCISVIKARNIARKGEELRIQKNPDLNYNEESRNGTPLCWNLHETIWKPDKKVSEQLNVQIFGFQMVTVLQKLFKMLEAQFRYLFLLISVLKMLFFQDSMTSSPSLPAACRPSCTATSSTCTSPRSLKERSFNFLPKPM